MQRQDEGQKRVGIWVRVSTEEQVRGESPEHHERRARAYAESKDWQIVQVYRLEAVSGKAVMAHPEAQRMLADVRDGTITGLVFSKLARLARNTRELLEFSEIFKANGADLISLGESIDTSSPAGRLFFTMIAAMATWEREEISARVQASIPIRAAMGKPTSGSSPFGYRWVNKRLVPDPKEAPVRALMYELFLEHRRVKAVCRVLNERGYRTRAGKPFSDTGLNRILDDPTAKGLHRANYTALKDKKKPSQLKPESEWVWVPVEPVVSEELWERCNAIRTRQKEDRRAAKPPAHLFTGYARCGCGAKMYVMAPSFKYICNNPACRNKIPADDLESVYRDQLTGFLVSPDEISAHEQAAQEVMSERQKLIEAAQAELATLDRKSDELFELYSAQAITKDDFGRKHKPISERRTQLGEELPRLQASLDILRMNQVAQEEAISEMRTLSERWSVLPFAEKRTIIESITDQITVGKDDIHIVLHHVPDGTSQNRQHSHRRPAVR